jgi:3-oxoacyl-[acyl-carrier-protein] synthase-3
LWRPIGATNAFAYDLQAACSSFLYGMSTAAATFNQRYKKSLLIGADKILDLHTVLLYFFW